MVLVFDVNETLLDLAALDPHFERIFGDATLRGAWFAQVLQSAMALTLTRQWADFGEVGRSALQTVARRQGVELTAEDEAAVLGQMRSLPAHSDVRLALERLREAGVRMAALSNSPGKGLAAQLGNAGLAEFFEQALSVDRVKKFKPHPDVYRMACRELRVAPPEMMLVAAHAWDVTGAMRAGCRGAFVARHGAAPSALDETPTLTGRDLGEVAEKALALR
jgi:2-haloacid dehalogenase